MRKVVLRILHIVIRPRPVDSAPGRRGLNLLYRLFFDWQYSIHVIHILPCTLLGCIKISNNRYVWLILNNPGRIFVIASPSHDQPWTTQTNARVGGRRPDIQVTGILMDFKHLLIYLYMQLGVIQCQRDHLLKGNCIFVGIHASWKCQRGISFKRPVSVSTDKVLRDIQSSL